MNGQTGLVDAATSMGLLGKLARPGAMELTLGAGRQPYFLYHEGVDPEPYSALLIQNVIEVASRCCENGTFHQWPATDDDVTQFALSLHAFAKETRGFSLKCRNSENEDVALGFDGGRVEKHSYEVKLFVRAMLFVVEARIGFFGSI